MALNQETTQETAYKVMEALHDVFPEVVFQMKAGQQTVCVQWVDGPLAVDVDQVLSLFQSYQWQGKNPPHKTATGYWWHGKRFVGAEEINASRHLSISRKALIVGRLAAAGIDDREAMLNEYQRMEEQLIQEGMLEGVKPNPIPPYFYDSPVEEQGVESEALNNVIPFPGMEDPAIQYVDQLMESLNLEQRFKLYCMHKLVGEDILNIFVNSEQNVDQLFLKLAKRLIDR